MYYMPTDLINNNYTYYINNDYLIVRTNQNCYNNYNTQYCDCVDIFPKLNYARSNKYSCSSSYSHTINYDSFSDNYIYRNDFSDIIIIFMFMCIFVFVIPYKVMMRLFRRFN